MLLCLEQKKFALSNQSRSAKSQIIHSYKIRQKKIFASISFVFIRTLQTQNLHFIFGIVLNSYSFLVLAKGENLYVCFYTGKNIKSINTMNNCFNFVLFLLALLILVDSFFDIVQTRHYHFNSFKMVFLNH